MVSVECSYSVHSEEYWLVVYQWDPSDAVRLTQKGGSLLCFALGKAACSEFLRYELCHKMVEKNAPLC